MSLARAFTKRGAKKSDISAPSPQRSGLAPKHSFSVGNLRSKISAPVELLSTTNMLSYNAPDLFPSNASANSDSESATTASSTPPTSPDTSSIEESSPTTVEPNHLSGASTRQSASSSISSIDPSAPVVPQRAPSHTKKSHEVMSRKLSMSRMSAQKNSISTTRSSLLMFSSNVDTIAEQQPPHPFGNELAKVSEIAEEFGVKDKMQVIDQEEQEMISRGLFKFCAEDYIKEIQGLFVSAFQDAKPSRSAAMWI
ncbi:hypothetical protein F5884DRAFT_681992 [Xylogone sp. PMI_703]|nr:hypothetical protein F5884DRAFT_681992 [Xylogone sp. PMI_703]